MKRIHVIQEIYNNPVLVFGCGNTLFGDDGFGPAVIEHLIEHNTVPEHVSLVDVGTSIRDYLFDLLLVEKKPNSILVLDAVSGPGKELGELLEIEIKNMPKTKTSDFSLHQCPSTNLLQELKTLGGVNVRVLGVHTNPIPNVIDPGLSPEVSDSVPKAAGIIVEWLNEIKI